MYSDKKEAASILGAGAQFPERLEAAASSDCIIRKFDSKINMSVKMQHKNCPGE